MNVVLMFSLLQEGKTEYMNNGDEFKLLHDKYNFLVLRGDINIEETNDEERTITEEAVKTQTPEKKKEERRKGVWDWRIGQKGKLVITGMR